jgi:hypothetical protein
MDNAEDDVTPEQHEFSLTPTYGQKSTFGKCCPKTTRNRNRSFHNAQSPIAPGSASASRDHTRCCGITLLQHWTSRHIHIKPGTARCVFVRSLPEGLPYPKHLMGSSQTAGHVDHWENYHCAQQNNSLTTKGLSMTCDQKHHKHHSGTRLKATTWTSIPRRMQKYTSQHIETPPRFHGISSRYSENRLKVLRR